jgi:hypothetical protein
MLPTVSAAQYEDVATRRTGHPRIHMWNFTHARYLLVACALLVGATAVAHADFISDREKEVEKALPSPPPPPKPKDVEKALTPPTVTPTVRADEPLNPVTLKADKDGQTVTITPSVTPVPPKTNVSGNGFVATTINNANDTIQDAQKKAEDAAKQAAEFPLKATEDALKIVGDAAKKAIEDIVAAAKAALEGQIDAVWAKYKLYVFAAGGVLFTILMSPALIAAWLVRRIGRRREKKMELALDQAIKVIRAYGKDAGVNRAA